MGRFRVADYVDRKLPPVCMAHRGFSGRYPECTALAFEKAVEIGADVVEFDVRQTADDHLVILHDPTPAKLTDGPAVRPVAELTLAALQELDMGLGQRMLTFDQLLEQFAGRIGMNIHVKRPGQTLDRVIDACRRADVLDQVFLAVGWEEEIQRLSRQVPDVWLCSLCLRTGPDLVEANARLGVRMVQPPIDVFIRCGRSLVDQARRAGVALAVSHADCYAHLMWMKRLGVAGVLTNFPDQMLQCFGRQTAVPSGPPTTA